MQATTDQPAISSHIVKTGPVKWKELKFIQQEGFKVFSPENKEKLRKTILNNNFIQPFYVWQSPEGIMFCLDGFHRILDLLSLEDEGVPVPQELPAIFIDCRERSGETKRIREIEAIKLRDRIHELSRHIAVIKRMYPNA